ncbi:hypothetical protein ACS0TY_004610 [Phlomoides rotata]
MMTEREMRSVYPLNGHTQKSDTEAASATAHDDAEELRRQKKRKWIKFIIFFIVSNVVINSIMAVTIQKARNPKFRIREANVTNFSNGGAPARLDLVFTLKNTNFGTYKYPNATLVFTHQGVEVGRADLKNNKVGWRKTKKFRLSVDLNLSNDLNSTVYPINAQGKLRGKAAIMFLMKKRKGADLNCTMNIERATQQISTITCK